MDNPKVFISYSWTSDEQLQRVLAWSERLVSDGIDVLLDRWELSEGDDKYAYMERMVTDKSVTHVIIFSDLTYAEKADKREAGVGTESQIISAEIYEKVSQSKFIPVVCEFNEEGKPCLPTFLKSRIYIDFSSPERVNSEWEKLIRVIFDKPLIKKPQLGKSPSYILEVERKPHFTTGKFETFKDAIINRRSSLKLVQSDYVDALKETLGMFSIQPSSDEPFDETLIKSLDEMLYYRNEILEFCKLQIMNDDTETSWEVIFELLESLLGLKYRPQHLTSWDEKWADNYEIFLYELIIYIVATFLKFKSYEGLATLFSHRFLHSDLNRSTEGKLVNFEFFYHSSYALKERNERLKLNRINLQADIIYERATLPKFPFLEIMQSEFIIFLRSILHQKYNYSWYPYTLIYTRYSQVFPFFVRSESRKCFRNLCKVLDVKDKTDLEARYREGQKKYRFDQWGEFLRSASIPFERLLNLTKLNTIE